jgi:hypothetical protein
VGLSEPRFPRSREFRQWVAFAARKRPECGSSFSGRNRGWRWLYFLFLSSAAGDISEAETAIHFNTPLIFKEVSVPVSASVGLRGRNGSLFSNDLFVQFGARCRQSLELRIVVEVDMEKAKVAGRSER